MSAYMLEVRWKDAYRISQPDQKRLCSMELQTIRNEYFRFPISAKVILDGYSEGTRRIYHRVRVQKLADPPQEGGSDHPWKGFTDWHPKYHEAVNIAWPCTGPLRCLVRYCRKARVRLTGLGEEGTA